MSQKTKILFYGIDRFFKEHSDNLAQIFKSVGNSGKVLMGPDVSLFEKDLAAFCSRKFAVTVSSCTDALYFALLSAKIKPEDEVIVPSFSFIATVTPVLQAGATPVFADITPDTLSIDVNDLKKKITSKTKAIIFVHLFGSFCPVKEIALIAKENNIFLIEDNAQSLGAMSNEFVKTGTLSDLSCVSFDPTKVIGGFGTAGAVLTDNESVFNHVFKLRNQGKNSYNGQYDVLGYNSRISSFQAAMLSYQLQMIDTLIDKRRKIASYYNAAIDNLQGIDYIQKENQSTFHKYVIKTSKRNELKNFLESRGIQTMIHYEKALFEHELFNQYSFRAENIKTVHQIKNNVLSLPIYPEMNDSEVEYVVKCLKEFYI